MGADALDQAGLDTQLARALHQRGRLDVGTLRGFLEEARGARGGGGDGPTLARVLAGRGVVPREELLAVLTALQQGGGAAQGSQSGEGWVARAQSGEAALASWVGRAAPPQTAPPPASADAAPPSAPLGPLGDDDPTSRLPRAERDPWRPGARVGGLDLVDVLGRGGMGIVFLAQDPETSGRFALKTVPREADENLLARFRREGEAQARVDDHPNVARVRRLGEEEGRPYLVMDHLPGGSLEDRLRRGPLPFDEAARVGAQVARGLAHLHAAGVVHRDLKPANVLFDAEGGARLTDFGLAAVEGAAGLTRSQDVVGTPSFMAPEQAMGERAAVGPWSDVFAFGALLHVALTGRQPFEGATSVEVMTRVITDDPPPVRSLRPDVPPALEAVCVTAMRKDRERRGTAAEHAAALEAFLTAAADSGAHESVGPSRLGAASVVAVVAAAAAALLGAALGYAAGREAGRAETAAVTQPPTVEPLAPPQEPAAPAPPDLLRWAWPPDAARRYSLTHDAEMPLMGVQVRSKQVLDLVLRAHAVAEGRLLVTATIEALAWTTESDMSGPLGQFAQVAEDTRTSPDGGRLASARGKEFTFLLDAATGAVSEVSGLEGIHGELEATAGEPLRQFLRFFMTGSRDELRRRLDRVFHVLPAAAPGRGAAATRWSRLARLEEGELLLGAEWLDPELGYEVSPIGEKFKITWSGASDGPNAARRSIEGAAYFTEGAVERAEWTERRVGVARMAGPGSSGPVRSRHVTRLERVRGGPGAR